MVAFYAYFLIFGVNEASNGKIKVAEKSFTVQVHIDNSIEHIHTDIPCFYYTAFTKKSASNIFTKAQVKQKWKHFEVNRNYIQDFSENSLFGRPPPAFA